MVGVLVLSARMLLGCLQVERLRIYGTMPAAHQWIERMKNLAHRVRVSQPVCLVESVCVEVPTVKVAVTPSSIKEPITLMLSPACELDITIVNADTGKRVSDADLWLSDADSEKNRRGSHFRSFQAPNISVSEGRKSSREGKLSVLVEPGEHQAGVGYDFHPEGFEIDKTGQLIDCPASQKIEITFKLGKALAGDRK